jgi:hypothetical protein
MFTRLFHAQLPDGGPTGICCQLGPSILFAPVNEERLYVLDLDQLVISVPVPDGMAAFLSETIIEPRLAALAGEEV